MKARLLAIATQRSARIERMQKVASTRPAAAKPTPSVTGRLLIRYSLRRTRRCTDAFRLGRIHRSDAQRLSDIESAALGSARQLSGTGAARSRASRGCGAN